MSASKTTIALNGSDILINEGREGTIPCGTPSAARGFFAYLARRPAIGDESTRAWVARCAGEYLGRAL
jgi:hypothetical protein